MLHEIPVEGARFTTSCCFGGPNLDELFVTSAVHGANDEQRKTVQSRAGSVFRITGLGVKGTPSQKFQY